MGVTRAALLLAGAIALAACQATTGPAKTVSLRVKGNVPSASVTIDDQSIGPLGYVAAHGVALPPGRHRITVEKEGYFPWDRLVEVKEGDPPVHLDVALVPIPD
jgi:hypothetical protein